MNNSKTPKIVIGVGLAAIYATGLAMFTMGDAHDKVVAQNATDAPKVQVAAEPVATPAVVPESSVASTSVAEQPTAMTATAAPVASTAAKTLGVSRAHGELLGKEPANSAAALPLSVQAESASSRNDSQVSTNDKVAAAAPAAAIDVTDKDGAVEATESEPSQEAIDKARLAARNEADVSDVDSSAVISN